MYRDPYATLTVRSLAHVVAKLSGVPVSDILGSRHIASHAKARHIVAWLARRFTRTSLPVIARVMQRRHHTTVLHSVARVNLVIAEEHIVAPVPDTPEAWAAALWDAEWPDLRNRDPMKVRA